MFEGVSRRGILAGGFAALAHAVVPASSRSRRDERPVMRLVHLTDVHLKAEGDLTNRFARCMDKIRNAERPDLVIQGGDIIFDGTNIPVKLAVAQYELAERLMHSHLNAPIMHCVGNHDICGAVPAVGGPATGGKSVWSQWTGYTSPYYSFDRANWHFIVLDSIQSTSDARGYIAHLGDAQWQWLEQDLAAVPSQTPVCIVSHAPFIHGGVQFLDHTQHRRSWSIPGTMLHIDARPFKDLLARRANVKLCLSGHIHMFSRVHYNGVAHIGNGAVSGAWWRGDMQETHPGYGVVDLYADGRVKSRFETY